MKTVRTIGLAFALAITGCTSEVLLDGAAEPDGDEAESAALALSIIACTDARRGSAPYGPLEANGDLAYSYMLTAIGGRIDGHDNLTTLALRGQEIRPDGTLGTSWDWRFGSDPGQPVEAWLEAPPGQGIVGIGLRASRKNLSTLEIRHRRYDATLMRFVGPTSTMRGGRDPSGPLEALFGTWQEPTDFDRTIIAGVGARSNDSNIKTLRVRYCLIQP